jgi:serine/threonine-protein kinase RIM15
MSDLPPPNAPVAPAVAALKHEAASHDMHRASMERTISEDIRVEREDLKEAAEYGHNVLLELGLDGIVRWVGPSFQEVVGIPADAVLSKPIEDFLATDTSVFQDAIDCLRKDDARSHIIRFSVLSTHLPKPRRKTTGDERVSESLGHTEGQEEQSEGTLLNLEGQGIMVYDRTSGQESHVSANILQFPCPSS